MDLPQTDVGGTPIELTGKQHHPPAGCMQLKDWTSSLAKRATRDSGTMEWHGRGIAVRVTTRKGVPK